MKLIIAGSRHFEDYDFFKEQIFNILNHIKELDESAFRYDNIFSYIDEIVSGGANGADTLAIKFAKEYKLSYEIFFANWDNYGRAAGPIRNKEMAQYADGLIAFWDEESTGTKNMIETMQKFNKQTFIIKIPNRTISIEKARERLINHNED